MNTLRLREDWSREDLIQHALAHEGAVLNAENVLTVATGSRTGRSVKDRYIVMDATTESQVAWGKNSQPYSAESMKALWQQALAYQQQTACFSSHLQVGADPKYGVRVHAMTEFAWHHLFVRNLFIREVSAELAESEPWTLLSLPGMALDPEEHHCNSEAGLFIDFTHKRVLACGLRYAGELKKSMFSVLNYLLPAKGVLPMHCAANIGREEEVALFFGLSGTGKTTLSADTNRRLIGDDEHGWSADGVFNFEGGCYAKCVDLSAKSEPMIWHATKQSTAILENVVLKDNREPDFSDTSLTMNTRACYPRDVIANLEPSNRGPVPKSVIFLTCDLYGVLPPVSMLTSEQARFWFLNGYTALVGSTEVGSTKSIQPTFSTCFGAAFFPRNPTVYADLLATRLQAHGAQVYLVNTGWTGGSYTSGGKRFPIAFTRALLDRILDGSCLQASQDRLPGFDLCFPTALPGLDATLLDPRKTWTDQAHFAKAYQELYQACVENFKQYEQEPALAD